MHGFFPFPVVLVLRIAGPEEAKNLAGRKASA